MRGIGIRADAQLAELVHPGHQLLEIPVHRGRDRLDAARDDLTGAAVEREVIALFEKPIAEHHLFSLVRDLEGATTGNTAFAHAARYDSGVRGHAATRGQ